MQEIDLIVSFTEKLQAFLVLTSFGNSFFGMFSVILSGILSMEFFENGTEYATAAAVSILMAFLVGIAFEIMADISDMEGDMQHRVQTVAWSVSPRFAAIISSLIFSVVFIFDPLPYVNLHPNLVHDKLFLLLILPVAVVYFLINYLINFQVFDMRPVKEQCIEIEVKNDSTDANRSNGLPDRIPYLKKHHI
ncbi:hypothetical protein J7W08_10255 [Methanococcoides orientis]|uniref:hypothetical protein n=1 Tax=Methanococcoides orientis TaxID=2822137 RepID=UPI001E5AF2CE|nr:hypothetical protein [Methanococcoides orientis]UGV40436.1 hypothetical protein J7W08_10255 [Methanococcoides orientis]